MIKSPVIIRPSMGVARVGRMFGAPKTIRDLDAVGGDGGGSSPYVGPLDIQAGAVAAFGQRALSAAWLGQPYATLRRDSDDAEMTFNFDVVTGEVPVSAITSWYGAANPFVKRWVNQSGSGDDAINADAASQIPWVAAGPNGKPSFETNDESAPGRSLTIASLSYPEGVWTIFAVGKVRFSFMPQAITPADMEFHLVTGGGYTDSLDGSGNEAGIAFPDFGTNSYMVTDAKSQCNLCDYYFNGVSVADGDFSSGTAMAPYSIVGTQIRPIAIGGQAAGAAEIIVYPTLMNDGGNRTLVRQNMANCYGITL